MRAMMGLIKDRHGTYYAQRKVPERLQEAVARVLNSGRDRQVFLKKSLGTKSLKAANAAATHVPPEAGFRATPALLRFCNEHGVEPTKALDHFEFEYDLPKE